MAHVGSVVPQEVASASSLARQRGEQICYASSTRHGQLRIELLQRLEGERALVQAGMRHGQAGLVEDDVPVEEEVEVDRPGAPALVAHATEPALDVEQHAEERPRLERRLDRDGAVDECRLSDASPGLRLAERRHRDDLDPRFGAEEADGVLDRALAVCEVRAEADVRANAL